MAHARRSVKICTKSLSRRFVARGAADVIGGSSFGGRGSKNQKASQMNPTAPVMTNAIFHPNATAIAGTTSGVATAPMFGAVFMMPSASERSPPRNQVATVLTAAGVPTASVTPSAMRTPTKPATVVTNA